MGYRWVASKAGQRVDGRAEGRVVVRVEGRVGQRVGERAVGKVVLKVGERVGWMGY